MSSLQEYCVSLAIINVAWVVFLLSFCKADHAASNREAEALIKWKDSLPSQSVFDSWVFPTHTNSSSSTPPTPSPCKWYGITCDNAGSVTQIELPGRGINGTLQNFDFSFFPNLVRLDLQSNNFQGPIPANIGMVSKLKLLDLSTNSLNGTLPLSLANLTQVSELDISRNDITGILDGRLFPGDQSSTQSKTGLLSLKYLLFQDTLLGGQIPKEIGNLKFLVTLVLDRSHFNGPIPPSLGNLSHLQALRLSENQMSGEIPETLVNLRNLTDLRLFANNALFISFALVGILVLIWKTNLSTNSHKAESIPNRENPFSPCDIKRSATRPESYGLCNEMTEENCGKLQINYDIITINYHSRADSGSNREAEALIKWKDSLPNQSVFETWIFPTQTNNYHSSKSMQRYGNSFNSAGNKTRIKLPDRRMKGTLQNSFNGFLPLSVANFTQGPVPESKIFQSTKPEAFTNNKALCGNIKGRDDKMTEEKLGVHQIKYLPDSSGVLIYHMCASAANNLPHNVDY
ncbi:hypothetical protein FEM48_Zijuj03G0135400 [Ziziphus jujuba var. spinosa]|uniref:Leucine-rich repeat-containing N-terminal plant-type domain-containing protein n=1 Tax=Ziziphus jujuba var. spinosa TaxID=714518 RepID=A0A978VQL1_ZIZJJ|nr:hypothetical protein FEM48_Zijuj03G0135400 [Ziziphus jujuba var. spinosa]